MDPILDNHLILLANRPAMDIRSHSWLRPNPNKIRLTQVKPSIGNIGQHIYPVICLKIGEDSLLNGIWA